jgi:hypothetical protein
MLLAEPHSKTERIGRLASVRRQIIVDVPIEAVWDAVRDFGALHVRLVSGFATDTRLEGEDRIVTFFNGNTLDTRARSAR